LLIAPKFSGRVGRRGGVAAPLAYEGGRAIVVEIGVAGVDQRSNLANAGFPAICEQQAHLRVQLLGIRRIVATRGSYDRGLFEIERAVELEVDEAGNAAFDQIRRAALDDVHARESDGRNVLLREATAGGGEDFTAVQRGQDVVETADADVGYLVISADLHLDAGHALQRGGGSRIGELADVFGYDRINDLRGFALDRGGLFQALAQTGNDNLRDAGVGLVVRRHSRGCVNIV
jgi:hypothetical protein